MSKYFDDQTLLSEFRSVAKALAREIEKSMTTAAIEPDSSAEVFRTEKEGQLASVRGQQASPKLERLIAHLRDMGAELRARSLLPAGAETVI